MMKASKFKVGDILVVSLPGNRSENGTIGKVTEITDGDYYTLDSNPNMAFKENCLRKANGAELIKLERIRQIEVEGWTAEHDAAHTNNELAWAAMCYADPEKHYDMISRWKESFREPNHKLWPKKWDKGWFKPKDRVRDLVKAGALIAAEIDRLQNIKSNIPEQK